MKHPNGSHARLSLRFSILCPARINLMFFTVLALLFGTASAQTPTNVTTFVVAPAVAGAQFTVGNQHLVAEEVSSGYGGDYYVHGLQRNDTVVITAPGYAPYGLVYDGSNTVTIPLTFSGTRKPLPAAADLWLLRQSATPAAATVWRGHIYYAGSLFWPYYPVIFGASAGSEQQLSERTTVGVSMATYNDMVYLAFVGMGNNYLNILATGDGGKTWLQKITLPYTSTMKPSLCACGNKLLLTWTDTTQWQIHTLESPDGVHWGTHRVLQAFSKVSPSAVHFQGSDYITYIGKPILGSWTDQIRLMRWNGTSWDLGPALPELSMQGPSLSVVAGRMSLSWMGSDQNHLVNTQALDASMNPGIKRTYNLSTTMPPFLLPYAFPSDHTYYPVDRPLVFYGLNDSLTFERFFDDGVFAPANGGFENGLASWATFSPNPGFTPHLSSFAADGSSSVQLDQLGIVYQDVGGLKPGKTYLVSALIAGNSRASGHLAVHDTLGANYTQSPDVIPGGWQTISTTFTATATGYVRVHLVRNDGTDGPIYYDSVSIEER